MSYNVYLDDKIAFENLTKEEAENKKKQMSQMIQAGLPTAYHVEDIKIYHYSSFDDLEASY